MTFIRSRQYVNPSRFDPALVTVRPVDNSHLALREDMNNIIIFVSTVIVGESHILSPKRIGVSGLLKYLTGVFHAIEWERACSFFCMAFSADRLTAQESPVLSCHACLHTLTAVHRQIAYDAINFQTKYDSDRRC